MLHYRHLGELHQVCFNPLLGEFAQILGPDHDPNIPDEFFTGAYVAQLPRTCMVFMWVSLYFTVNSLRDSKVFVLP